MKLFGFALEVLQIAERLGHFMGNYLLIEHGKTRTATDMDGTLHTNL